MLPDLIARLAQCPSSAVASVYCPIYNKLYYCSGVKKTIIDNKVHVLITIDEFSHAAKSYDLLLKELKNYQSETSFPIQFYNLVTSRRFIIK